MTKKSMNKSLMGLALSALALLMVSGARAEAEESKLEFELGVDLVSKYVWRGQLLTDDPVLQPGATVSFGGLSLNVWGSIDMTDINETGSDDFRLQEVDYTLSYGFTPVDGLDLEAGVIYYDFPGTGFKSTSEVYLSGSLSSVPLSPTLAVYYDFDEVEGYYVNLSIGHTFELTDNLGLSLGAGLGWSDADYNMAYFGVNDSALGDLTVSAALEYAVNENFGISVYAGYSEMLDREVEDALADPDIFTAGVNVTFSF
jgi:uncharacterized protein (TIGR02001 family)